ncbi:MAG: methionine gamma-lyase family protein, partial [Candidatus Baltobacteraceae bacterium]
MIELLCREFAIAPRVCEAALRAQARIASVTYPAAGAVKARVLRAFYEAGLNDSDLTGSSGYGYDDAARQGYETLIARIFGVERALARLSIVSGTHAIVTALAACVPPGERLLSAAGSPYDTLRNAICDAPGSLVAQGIVYDEVALASDGTVDIAAVAASLQSQRARAV